MPFFKNPVSIGIVALGDSHVAGSISLPNKPLVVMSERDKMWNGTADADTFLGNSGINIKGGSLNANLVNGDQNMVSLLCFMINSLRQTELFDRIRLANCAIGGSSSYDWAGEMARLYVQFPTNPNIGDTLTVDSRVYTYVAAAGAPDEITIGGTTTVTSINTHNAVNAESTGWGAGTTKHATVFAQTHPSNDFCQLHSLVNGTAGNSLTASTTGGPRITLPFGASFTGGLAESSIMTGAIGLVPAGFGPVDIVFYGIGTNDAFREGWHGIDTEAQVTEALVQIRVQWPDAAVVVWTPPVYTAQASMATTVKPAMDAAFAAETDPITIVDLYAYGAGAGNVDSVDSGGVHMTDYFSAIAGQMMANGALGALGMV